MRVNGKGRAADMRRLYAEWRKEMAVLLGERTAILEQNLVPSAKDQKLAANQAAIDAKALDVLAKGRAVVAASDAFYVSRLPVQQMWLEAVDKLEAVAATRAEVARMPKAMLPLASARFAEMGDGARSLGFVQALDERKDLDREEAKRLKDEQGRPWWPGWRDAMAEVVVVRHEFARLHNAIAPGSIEALASAHRALSVPAPDQPGGEATLRDAEALADTSYAACGLSREL